MQGCHGVQVPLMRSSLAPAGWLCLPADILLSVQLKGTFADVRGGARGPGCFNVLASSIDVYKIWEIFCFCLKANMNAYRTWVILCLFKASEMIGPFSLTI